MKSMTGYGRGECAAKGAQIVVELNTVNRKQVEVTLGVPAELESVESELRDMVLASISRGRVNGRVTLRRSGANRAASVHYAGPPSRRRVHERKAVSFRFCASNVWILTPPSSW